MRRRKICKERSNAERKEACLRLELLDLALRLSPEL